LGHQGETAFAQELEARAAVVLHRNQLHRGALAAPKRLAGRLRHPQRLGVPPQLVERDAQAAHDLGDEVRLPLGRAAQRTLHEAVRRLGQRGRQ